MVDNTVGNRNSREYEIKSQHTEPSSHHIYLNFSNIILSFVFNL